MTRQFMFGNGSFPAMEAGLYTPTLTPVTNVDTASMNSTLASYFRIGDLVFVFTTVYINPTATGAAQIDISLPVASDFTGVAQANGAVGTNQNEVGRIEADVTNNRMSLYFVAAVTTEHTFCVVASYQVV